MFGVRTLVPTSFSFPRNYSHINLAQTDISGKLVRSVAVPNIPEQPYLKGRPLSEITRLRP